MLCEWVDLARRRCALADPEIADLAERVITRFAGSGLVGEFRGAEIEREAVEELFRNAAGAARGAAWTAAVSDDDGGLRRLLVPDDVAARGDRLG